jgi:cardiolipin synthase
LPQYHGKTGKEPWLDYAIQIDDPIIAKKKTSITLQRPLFERYFFEEDQTANTDKTIVIIQNMKERKFMMLILIPLLLPKEIVIVGSYFPW